MNRRIIIAGVAVLGLTVLSAFFWVPPVFKPTGAQEDAEVPLPTPTATAVVSREMIITVRDSETGEPLPGADIEVAHTRGTADAAGTYRIPVRNGVAHPVTVRFPGYDTWQGEVDAGTGHDAPLPVSVALEPNTVRGQVVGHDGTPLPDAAVNYRGSPVVLDGEGRFELQRVLPGDLIAARRPGYRQVDVALDGLRSLQLVLEPITVLVHVRDALMDIPVPDATVCAEDRCQSTDARGDALVQGAVPGKALAVERQGYQTARLAYLHEETLTVELRPEALHGYVLDAETGNPITRTVVVAGDQIAPMDGSGMFRATGLSEANSLFVKAPGYRRVEIPLVAGARAAALGALDVCSDTDVLPCAEISLEPFAVRGVYASYNILMWDKQRLLDLIDLVDRSPMLNGIVVDIKGDFGHLAFVSDDPLIASVGAMSEAPLPVPELLRICKEKGIYTVARMVVFKDSPLIATYPELAVRHPDGEIFYDREGMAWADPMKEEVWEYNIAITLEAIRLGFDEVQYDYLRFPSDSTSLAIVRALVYKEPSTIESRTAAIEGFVRTAKAAVDPTHAFLSADLFGYALVIHPDHDMRIGQRLKDLAPHVDYLCPMIYPSTFESGNLGLASPKDSPYEVIQKSMALAQERTDTPVRPWLQHYWYEREQIEAQWRAAEEATDVGWCYWNARGIYDEEFFGPPPRADQ